MKRSKIVNITSIMLATATVSACGGVDDRTSQAFNYDAEKKLKVDCNKPEDFSMPECHRGNNNQPARTHTAFMPIYTPLFYGGYGGGGYRGSYGPTNSGSRSYSTARTAVQGRGLTNMYRSATVNTSGLSRMGSMGTAISARSVGAISRGGFGATGKGVAIASGFSAASSGS